MGPVGIGGGPAWLPLGGGAASLRPTEGRELVGKLEFPREWFWSKRNFKSWSSWLKAEMVSAILLISECKAAPRRPRTGALSAPCARENWVPCALPGREGDGGNMVAEFEIPNSEPRRQARWLEGAWGRGESHLANSPAPRCPPCAWTSLRLAPGARLPERIGDGRRACCRRRSGCCWWRPGPGFWASPILAPSCQSCDRRSLAEELAAASACWRAAASSSHGWIWARRCGPAEAQTCCFRSGLAGGMGLGRPHRYFPLLILRAPLGRPVTQLSVLPLLLGGLGGATLLVVIGDGRGRGVGMGRFRLRRWREEEEGCLRAREEWARRRSEKVEVEGVVDGGWEGKRSWGARCHRHRHGDVHWHRHVHWEGRRHRRGNRHRDQSLYHPLEHPINKNWPLQPNHPVLGHHRHHLIVNGLHIRNQRGGGGRRRGGGGGSAQGRVAHGRHGRGGLLGHPEVQGGACRGPLGTHTTGQLPGD